MSARAGDGPAPMPIAIIGIGCRFPGDVVDADSFWQLLINGVDAITTIPADRFDVEPLHDPKPGTRGRVATRFGGFVGQPLEEFDAAFFGISRSYAERLDPQQRLLLETGWEAMEDAGLDIVGLQGSPTGVFVGQWVSDFEHRLFADTSSIDFQMAMGSGRYAAAGRLSYAYGFRGPSLSIDAACSSGLACVHLAVRSLRSGDSAIALAGGVNMILQPHIHLAYSYGKMLAPDGRCRFGDASGGGYVRSEGAGMVVLKPLHAALADGDRVYAVIRGSAVNNDGNSSGAMGRPSRIGQEELIRGAWSEAGVRASQIAYVEAHGTGTRAGDPVELSALGAALADDRAADAPRTWVGSVKTNFGHTEAAAGIAGLIKASLMLRHGQIPPSLHFATPNPEVAWDRLPIAVPTQLMPWPTTDVPRYAGVSSYGIGGTNAHVLLESAPASGVAGANASSSADGAALLLPLSARHKTALRTLAQRYATLLDSPAVSARDVCWSAATRRSALPHRAAFVAPDREALRAALRAYAAGDPATAAGVAHDTARRRVAFVVPGQGAQWVGMARQLMTQHAVFRETIESCDAALRTLVPWSLVEQLQLAADDPAYRGHRIDVIQPTLVAIAMAYAAWLRSIGVTPDAVVGHSLGEVGAAAIAGVIDAATAMKVIVTRSALLQRTSGQGAMAVIDLPQGDVETRIASSGSDVTVAVSNSPRSTVISGTPAAVQAMLLQLERDGVFARLVNVDVASHGPQMDPLVPELVAALQGISTHAATTPIYSTVLAGLADGDGFAAEYWGRNLRQPVQFARTIEAMIADGISTFVELGPHPVLRYALTQTADALGREVVATTCGQRDSDEVQALQAVVATVWASGVAIDWQRAMPSGGAVVSLPFYPFQRERFWYDTTTKSPAKASRAAAIAGDTVHPCLGDRVETAADGGGIEWEVRFSSDDTPWLADHVVRGSAIVPAAAVIDVMVAAVRSTLGAPGDVILSQLMLREAIPLAASDSALRLVALRPAPQVISLELRARDDRGWRVVASATGGAPPDVSISSGIDQKYQSGPAGSRDGVRHYRDMTRRALAYGPAFQVVTGLAGDGTRAAAQLRHTRKDQLARRVTLLDGALQVLLGMAPPHAALPHETIVPVRVESLVAHAGEWTAAATADVQRASSHDGDLLTGDIAIVNDDGAPRVTLRGVAMQVVRATSHDSFTSLQHAVIWGGCDALQAPDTPAHWLLVADAGGAATGAAHQLRAAGHVVTEWSAAEMHEAAQLPDGVANVVICTPLDAAGNHVAVDAALTGTYDVPLRVLQHAALTAGAIRSVLLVTHGAVAVHASDEVTSPLQGAAWGLARVARHEHPALGCRVMDVDPNVLGAALLAGVAAASSSELAWRDGKWWSTSIVRNTAPPIAPPADSAPVTRYVADTLTPGLVETIGWRGADAPVIGPLEVQVAVEASGLNFLDVLGALNAYPTEVSGRIAAAPALGLECSGVITRVGRDVRDLAVGDRVMAVCEGALANVAVAQSALVARIPNGMSFADASGFPIAFLTAARALEHAARLVPGERVLIHSAAGGVGLAALQIARARGAVVFATAGTPEKRALLQRMGVTHVFDSRTLQWGDDVRAATGGRGVDVVLNSLAGAAIETGMQALATYGRFIEIGKRDVFGGARMGMDVFRKQAMVTSVYLLEQMREDVESLGALFQELVGRLSRGELVPLPTTTWKADAISDAFRSLLPGTHIGKVVVMHDHPPATVRAPVSGTPIRAHATYLVTGGLGALGLRAAGWLVSRGAQHIVLVGRRAPDTAARERIASWTAVGVRVTTLMLDIGDATAIDAFAALLSDMPPLAGVLHAAGTLDDGVLAAQTPARLRAVALAKVGGLLQLQRLPGFASSDFVVLYSSVAGTLGTRGQANYAAANAVLDAMAHQLRAQGIRATSIGFGPFAGAGMATDGRGLDVLADSGLDALALAYADRALDVYAGSLAAHAMVASFDADAWVTAFPTAHERAQLSQLLSTSAPPVAASEYTDTGVRARLAAAVGPRARSDVALAFVCGEIAAVLRTAVERVEPMQALRAMGIDSLTSLELRNRLEHGTGLSLPGTLVFAFPTAAAIAAHLLERLTAPAAPDAAAGAPVTALPTHAPASAHDHLDALARELGALDDDVVRRLLATEGMGERQ